MVYRSKSSVVFLASVVILLLGTSVSAAYIPPRPMPQIPPTVGWESATSLKPNAVTFTAGVIWHYNPAYMRIIKVLVYDSDNTKVLEKQMYYDFGPNNYFYTWWNLDPAETYHWKVKASEYYWDPFFQDYIKVSASTGSHDIESCKPEVSVTVEDKLEIQATCLWTVNWGREGQGSDWYAEIQYRYSDSTAEYDESITDNLFPGSSGSTLLTNLVMDTSYDCRVKVCHTVHCWDYNYNEWDVPIEGEWSDWITFTSGSWNPVSKYAVVLDLTNNIQDNAQVAHFDAFDNMKGVLPDAGFHPDKIHAKQLDPDSTADDFVGNLTYWNDISTTSDFVFIYIVGHGNGWPEWPTPHLCISKSDTPHDYNTVDVATFASALSSIPCGKMVLVIESCHSGDLFPEISADNRVVVTATDREHDAPIVSDVCIFSDTLVNWLGYGYDFLKAFNQACQVCWNYENNPFQNPRLDDIQNTVSEWYGTVGWKSLDPDYHPVDPRIGSDGLLAKALTLDIQIQT